MSKKRKSKGGRPTIWIVLVLILMVTNAATVYYFTSIVDSVPAEDVPLSIADVWANSDDYVGSVVTINGYYLYAADNHLLVLDPLFYFNNSLDVDNYLVITGQVPAGMSESLGMQVSVKGLLQVHDSSDGTLRIQYRAHAERVTSVLHPGSYYDVQYDPYPQFEELPFLYDTTEEKYAVLYSGGIKPEKAYSRYWNDIIYMYFILQMHGYDSDNIYVIYKDGVGEDTYTPVDYPATHDSLDTVFDLLSEEMGTRDTLFFYTTNHGGGGGISVWGPMDSSGALTHSQVSDWLDSITCHHMIIVMEQCVSGKFIQYISAENRVILTACKDDQSSYSCDTEGNWDEFVFHFMCALVSLHWSDPEETVDADLNDDELISLREAFIWAAAMDSRPETPWYNDNGNGVGYNVLQVAFGSGPWYGDSIYL